MKLLGRNFDFGTQKWILFITMFTGVALSFSVIAFTSYMFGIFSMDLDSILIGSYASYAVMSGANLSLFVLYIFLFLSTKIRFQQVNNFLRYAWNLIQTTLNHILTTSHASAMISLRLLSILRLRLQNPPRCVKQMGALWPDVYPSFTKKWQIT